ncbi:MAG: hypothetical protein E7159_01245 [Firmicutes bacterium]|nr:hypothetical protein [Bacillota bacterium]
MKKMLNERYLVHDEVLYELYNLKPDTIKYQIINGIPYLVNMVKQRTFELGFRIRLDKKLDERVESGTYLNRIDSILEEDMIISTEKDLMSRYEKFLCLSNFERYLMNVLFDKNLDSYRISTINLKEIEIKYRSMAMSRRYITLNKDTYERYIRTLELLCNKELYINTSSTFRKTCYGVNNLQTVQKLLNVQDYSFDGSNNVEITYSFGILGDIIKNSKRYSALAPARCFKVNTNQVKRNLTAMFIARKLYIARGVRQNSIEPYFMFSIDLEELSKFIEDPFEPISSNYNRYKKCAESMAYKILCDMKNNGTIYGFDVKEYTNKPRCAESKEDMEREEYFKELNEYWGEKETKIKRTIYKDIVVYISEPPFEYLARELINSSD